MNHRDASSLLPWFVNGTLSADERQKVDAHCRGCAECREDLALETAIHRGMAADHGVEYMPAASLKRFQSALDRLDAGQDQASVPLTGRAASLRPAWRYRARREFRRYAWVASTAAVVVAAGLFSFDRMRAPERAPAAYHTVTNSEPRSPREVIRAVFSPNTTLVELQALLDEAQLGIISGPTEAGVYSLEARSNRPVSVSLALLRQHPTVRFAESTRSDTEGGPARSGASP